MQISKNNLDNLKKREFDAIVIGGGAAGLSAGIYLQRYNLKSLIIEKGRGRSFWMQNVNNYLGFPPEESGATLLRKGRKRFLELEGDYLNGFVEEVTQSQQGFSVRVKLGRKESVFENFSTKYLIVASGIIDYLPALEDMTNVYQFAGYTLHVCLICDGYEMTGKKAGLFIDSEEKIKIFKTLAWFTPKITVFTNGLFKVSSQTKEELAQNKIDLIEEKIECFLGKEHQLEGVRLKEKNQSGEHKEVELETGLIAQGSKKHHDFLQKIEGLRLSPDKTISTNEKRETSVPNLYVLGDIKTGLNQVAIAVADGSIAATDIWRKARLARL